MSDLNDGTKVHQSSILTPSPPSTCSVCIETLKRKADETLVPVGWGTGFFYRAHGSKFLLTNWHVLTGRNPDDRARSLIGMHADPDAIRVSLIDSSNPGLLREGEPLNLYEKGKPIWLEYDGDETADLAAIRFEPPQTAIVTSVQDFCNSPTHPLLAGMDVAIIGFPFKRSGDFPAAIWKRAMVASEPVYLMSGKPNIFLDTPGHSGMSGSPVYTSGLGMRLEPEQAKLMNSERALDFISSIKPEQFNEKVMVLEFVGVYCGSNGDAAMAHLNLGRMIRASVVGKMLNDAKFKSGENAWYSGAAD